MLLLSQAVVLVCRSAARDAFHDCPWLTSGAGHRLHEPWLRGRRCCSRRSCRRLVLLTDRTSARRAITAVWTFCGRCLAFNLLNICRWLVPVFLRESLHFQFSCSGIREWESHGNTKCPGSGSPGMKPLYSTFCRDPTGNLGLGRCLFLSRVNCYEQCCGPGCHHHSGRYFFLPICLSFLFPAPAIASFFLFFLSPF